MDIAKELGKKQAVDIGNQDYYLTICNTIRSIKIIDFACCTCIYQMLKVLYALKIDVLTDRFKAYIDEKNIDNDTLEKLKPHYDIANSGEASANVKFQELLKIKLGDNSYPSDVGLFGQRLTDFSNGKEFVRLVEGYDAAIDGYRWRESGDMRGLTYCFFDSHKLSIPNQKKYF